MSAYQTSTGNERDVRGAHFVFFGGSTGIGRAAAMALAKRGASILIVGRGRAAGEAAVAQLRSAGAASADFLQADLSTVAGVTTTAAGVIAWCPVLHGVMHTAMSAFSRKQVTADGFELAFALQYLARAALNRLLADALAQSRDGRVVQIAGNIPGFIRPDLDDLQFERRKWRFFKAVLGTHVLGFLHIQEAARRWQDRSTTIAAACVESVKTRAMSDPAMPWIMRVLGRLGTTPELAARNAVQLLTRADVRECHGAILRSSKRYAPEPLVLEQAQSARLWDITTQLAAGRGLSLPDA